MRIKVFEDSREMMGYCKMAWLGNIEYKIHFFQTYKNNTKIKVYFVLSREEAETLTEFETALLELWKEKEPEKAARALGDLNDVLVD